MGVIQVDTTDGKVVYAKIPYKWEALFNTKYRKYFDADCIYFIKERNKAIFDTIPNAECIIIISKQEQEDIIKNNLYKYDFTSWEGRSDS